MSSHAFARTLMDETGYLCRGPVERSLTPWGFEPEDEFDRMAQAYFGLSPRARRVWPSSPEPVGESARFLGRRAGRFVLRGSAMETLHRPCAGLDVHE